MDYLKMVDQQLQSAWKAYTPELFDEGYLEFLRTTPLTDEEDLCYHNYLAMFEESLANCEWLEKTKYPEWGQPDYYKRVEQWDYVMKQQSTLEYYLGY